MNKLKADFSLKSMVDDFGRIFFKDGKVFRAIQNDKIDYCLTLLESEMFKELFEKELVPKTEIADFCIEGYDLILQHEKVLEILQHEWSFDMLKDAALAIFEINEICNKYGYELKDSHTLNILFKGVKPIMVDIGSISKKNDYNNGNWRAYEEFLGSFVIPLLFWEKKMNYITRKLVESNFHRMFTIPSQPIAESGLMLLLHKNKNEYQFKFRNILISTQSRRRPFLSNFSKITQSIIKSITGRNTKLFTYQDISEQYNTLIDFFPITDIKTKLNNTVAPEQSSAWQGYHQKFYSKDNVHQYSARFLRILSLIKSESNEINSVIDLAGNEGYFCELLNDETNIKRIILADYDENAINSAYLNFKHKRGNRVHTLLLNFMFTPDMSGTFKRFKSDLVVALAVTHHLILSSNFSVGSIFERLKGFSNKFVMVEFMPLGLWSTGSEIYPDLPEWYNVKWFRKEFEFHFALLHEEQLEKNRVLFFGKKFE